MSYIDQQACLAAAGNRAEVADEILAYFVKELPNCKADIKHNWQQQHFKQLQSVVHKLHGSCCYTGVPVLKQQIADLEVRLHQGQTQVSERVEGILQIIDAVICEYQDTHKQL